MSVHVPEPSHRHLVDGRLGAAATTGGYRILELAGLAGVNPTAIATRITLPGHTAAADRGAVAVQFFALEDLGSTTFHPFMAKHNPHCQNYTLLSDCADHRQAYEATFALAYASSRNPDLFGKFFYGAHEDAYYDPERAYVNNNFMDILAGRWYQVVLSWDKPARRIRLHVNGIRCGAENQGATELVFESPGAEIHCGNPTFCLRDIEFFDRFLDDDQVACLYGRAGLPIDQAYQALLRRRYAGVGNPRLDWAPGVDWRLALDLPLRTPADLARFFIQGNQDGEAPRTDGDGLHVRTYQARPGHRSEFKEGRRHLYLWSEDRFEGDISVQFDFMPLQEHGLSLLLVHASGMQREDFMRDYPRRVTGVMAMVGWEDVRNYQWEFFRQMDDVRNDVASSAITKNPWQRKLGYGVQARRMQVGTWYRAHFLKEGTRIRCAIDGEVTCDVEDPPLQNNGPTLSFGRIALRAMCRTEIVYRDLRVHTRPRDFTVVAETPP